MKKLSLLFTALAVTLCLVYSSCKKTSHDTNPTPVNTRLLSYTKTTTSGIASIAGSLGYSGFGYPVLETYTFSYDNNNRVSRIVYTTNDSVKHNAKLDNLIMTFNYSGSMITKTITKPDLSVVEVDSFIENSGGLVTNAYTPTLDNVYQYYGKLLSRNTIISHDSLGTATTVSTITSNSGNFLQLTYDDQLALSFTGLQPSISPIHLWYTYYNTTLAGIITSTNTQTISSSSTVVNSYTRVPMTVMATDTLHDTAYANYPGGIWTTQDYAFTGDYNRTGDYLQLQSFTTYGTNIYQNAKLVSSIKNSGYTTNVSYVMDAQSEITQTSVTITDSLGAPTSLVYKLQYQNP